jgi:diguanylate cyclase (GGDEF)-like protein
MELTVATRSIAHIQFRLFFILLLFFAAIVFGYRIFIERPQLELAINKIIDQQLSALSLAGQQELEHLKTVNYDYSVWDDSYDFVQQPSQEYIDANLVDDTFFSLKIDGIIYIDEHFNVIFNKGFAFKSQKPLNFSFVDFGQYPDHKTLKPVAEHNQQIASRTGLILTQYGPALFSATDIRRSDKSGEDRGFLLFIRLIDQALIDKLAKFTFTSIVLMPYQSTSLSQPASDWLSPPSVTHITNESIRYLHDFLGQAIGELKMAHADGVIPPWLDWHSLLFVLLFLSLLVIIYAMFSCKITQPINLLAKQIKHMANSKILVNINEVSQVQELHAVAHYFNQLIGKINQQNAKLNQQAYNDVLTNITNRRGFELYFEQQVPLFMRHRISFTLLLADIDHFKLYNDHYGHDAGDQTLIAVASNLATFFKRKSDICARYGGEEFVMICTDTDTQKLHQHIDNIIQSFAMLNIAHEQSTTQPYVTISVGVCQVDVVQLKHKHLEMRELLRQADGALYQAKHQGRNRLVIVNYVENK